MKLKLFDWLLACLFWLVLFLACSGCSAQNREKAQFRPKAEIGENTAKVGILLLVIAASGIIDYQSNENKALVATGGSMICVGVKININSGKDKKVKRIRFKR